MSSNIEGSIASINESGDLVTDIPNDKIKDLPSDDSVTVTVSEHHTLGIFPPDHNEPESTLIAVFGQSGFLEIGIVGLSISDMLGIGVGESVSVTW